MRGSSFGPKATRRLPDPPRAGGFSPRRQNKPAQKVFCSHSSFSRTISFISMRDQQSVFPAQEVRGWSTGPQSFRVLSHEGLLVWPKGDQTPSGPTSRRRLFSSPSEQASPESFLLAFQFQQDDLVYIDERSAECLSGAGSSRLVYRSSKFSRFVP